MLRFKESSLKYNKYRLAILGGICSMLLIIFFAYYDSTYLNYVASNVVEISEITVTNQEEQVIINARVKNIGSRNIQYLDLGLRILDEDKKMLGGEYIKLFEGKQVLAVGESYWLSLNSERLVNSEFYHFSIIDIVY